MRSSPTPFYQLSLNQSLHSLTHGPPFRILDQNNGGIQCGCPAVARKIEQVRPALHVFGHIHESHGAVVREWKKEDLVEVEGGEEDAGRTVYVNAALEARPKPLGEFELVCLRFGW